MKVSGVLFDLGGVVLGSPLQAIAEFEETHKIAKNFININIALRGRAGAFARLERGELPIEQFYIDMKSELAHPDSATAYHAYLKKRNRPAVSDLGPVHDIDTASLFSAMHAKSATVNPSMAHALFVLRGLGFTVAALTNNWQTSDGSDNSATNIVGPMFDMIFQSYVIGLRKPDPRIYHLALERMSVSADETVFLDDIGTNLKSAAKEGLATIKVEVGHVSGAISELEAILRERNGNLGKSWTLNHNSPSSLRFHDVDIQLYGHAASPPVLLVGLELKQAEAIAKQLERSGFCVVAVLPSIDPSTLAEETHRIDQLMHASRLDTRRPCLFGFGRQGLALLGTSCMPNAGATFVTLQDGSLGTAGERGDHSDLTPFLETVGQRFQEQSNNSNDVVCQVLGSDSGWLECGSVLRRCLPTSVVMEESTGVADAVARIVSLRPSLLGANLMAPPLLLPSAL